jgi:hypothetical protein
MAEQVVPQHVPRDQLRTEAPKQHDHDDKYVTAFVSGRPDVDITLMNSLLPKSADHYKVGVDELALNVSGLSMLEFNTAENNVLFQFKRRGLDGEAADPSGDDWALGNAFDHPANVGSTFQISRPFTNMQDITQRLNEIANFMTEYVHTVAIQDATLYPKVWNAQAQTNATNRIVKIYMNAAGQLVISAPVAFWANFVIEIPQLMYQQSIRGAAQQWFGINPSTRVQDVPKEADGSVVGRLSDQGGAIDYDNDIGDVFGANAVRVQMLFQQNLCNTLDRRVTVELSCSLPLKNSPMIDHDKESLDYTLGRWVFQREMSIQTTLNETEVKSHLISHDFGIKQLQDSTKRVTYHHLRPQQKIQVVRLRLWARVRTYTAAEGWNMKTIIVPMLDNDYWHARLHFVTK